MSSQTRVFLHHILYQFSRYMSGLNTFSTVPQLYSSIHIHDSIRSFSALIHLESGGNPKDCYSNPVLGPLSISCHSQSYFCNFLTSWWNTLLVFIHRKSHLANMMIMLDYKFFFVLSTYLTQNTPPVTCHMTGQYAIHELLHGHNQWAFLYYSQALISFTGLLSFGSAKLHCMVNAHLFLLFHFTPH
jgi:hypothetical protein